MGAVTATSSAYDVVQTSLSGLSSSAVIQEKWDGMTREEKENTPQELEKKSSVSKSAAAIASVPSALMGEF